MNKTCTDLAQSKKLIELGIDINTADMVWTYDFTVNDINGLNVISNNFKIEENDIPSWSLSALLELIPDKISINNESYYLSFDKKSVAFRGPVTWDGQKSTSFEMDNILDAAFEMVCWLLPQNKSK